MWNVWSGWYKRLPYYYNILFFIYQQEKKELRAPGEWLPAKSIFFYYNIYFIICQVYMACGRDESNIFFNNNDDDDGVIVREWMGPVAPTLANS